MSITLHPTISHSEAQHIARLLDCQIIPNPRNPGDYIITPRIVRHDHRNNVVNFRMPVSPVVFPRIEK